MHATPLQRLVSPSIQTLPLAPNYYFPTRFMASVTVDTAQGPVTLMAVAEKDFVAAEAVRRGAKQIMLPKTVTACKALVERLRAKDPKARAATLRLIQLAKAGSPKARQAVAILKKVAKGKGSPMAETSGLREWNARGLAALIALAKRGNPKAISILQSISRAKKSPGAPKTGYYPFPVQARAGIDMSAKSLPPARIQYLQSLLQRARNA